MTYPDEVVETLEKLIEKIKKTLEEVPE